MEAGKLSGIVGEPNVIELKIKKNIVIIYNGKIIFSGSKNDFESKMDSVSYDDTLIKIIDNA